MIARTRIEVLRAAAAELAVHGIAGADLGRIAASAGVDDAVVLAGWPRFEDLLSEALLAALADIDSGGAAGVAAALRRGPIAGLVATVVDAAFRDPFWEDVLVGLARRIGTAAGDAAPLLVYRALVERDPAGIDEAGHAAGS